MLNPSSCKPIRIQTKLMPILNTDKVKILNGHKVLTLPLVRHLLDSVWIQDYGLQEKKAVGTNGFREDGTHCPSPRRVNVRGPCAENRDKCGYRCFVFIWPLFVQESHWKLILFSDDMQRRTKTWIQLNRYSTAASETCDTGILINIQTHSYSSKISV